MAANTQEEQKELVRLWDAQERELAELGRKMKDAGHIGQYLEQDSLVIERVQFLDHQMEHGKIYTHAAWKKDKWATSQYLITTATGGPHVEFDTDYIIHVYWANGVWEDTTYDKDAIKAIKAIGYFLDAMYG